MAFDTQREIQTLIPHRDPFLFVDEILEFEAHTRVLTTWNVRTDHDFFRGHYPDEPVLPGVLISEYAFQSGAILLKKSADEGWDDSDDAIPVLAGIEKARFRRLVRPGTTLRAEVRLDRSMANARYMSAKVESDEGLVARLKFVLAMANEGADDAGGGAG